jgi:hypothetical protein
MRGKARKIAARGRCRVYWSTHGCSKQRGHVGRHYCEPGCPIPNETTIVFGEDVDLYPSPAGAPRPERKVAADG